MSKGRRVGTAHHPIHSQRQNHPQSQPSRCWGAALLTILPMVMFWPRIATGQLLQTSAGGMGLNLAESTQPLDSETSPNLEWGEPLPTDPEDPDPETADELDTENQPDAGSPPGNESPDPVYLRPSEACPAEYETLVTTLLRDLPQYANLVAARSFRPPIVSPATDTENPATPAVPAPLGTMLIASQPDFEPIDLTDRAFGAGLDAESDLRQVFFTTLERQYLSDQVVSLQQFHWLFLVQTEDGWRSVLLYSSLGGYPDPQRLTPPQESSQGIVGQAVRLWLRDCRAGAVLPPASSHL
ncbi:MAG: hypothetical protein ACHWZW_03730 [Spirulina sp.]